MMKEIWKIRHYDILLVVLKYFCHKKKKRKKASLKTKPLA